MAVAMVLFFIYPEYATKMILIMRILMTAFILTWIVWRYDGNEICTKPVTDQIKHFGTLVKVRQDMTNFYILFTIWVSPFSNYFYLDFTMSSLSFAITFVLCSHYMEDDGVSLMLEIPMWWMTIFFSVYFIRVVLT